MSGKSPFIALMLVLFLFGVVQAGNMKTERFSFKPKDIENLDISIDLGAGQFDLRVDDIDEAATAQVEYNERKVEVYGDYDERGRTGIIEFESETRRKFNVDTEDNIWDITLSDKYPTELNIDIGACESRFDLGGLPLEFLDLDVGAADAVLTFSRPNPGEAEEIVIDAGAASFKVKKLGNANFSRLSFDGGVGDFEIDFSGEYRGKSRAKVSIGLGSARVIIPHDLPVRIEADDSFLSSVDFDNADDRYRDDDYYETDNYRSSDYGLDLEISVGLGSIEVIFED